MRPSPVSGPGAAGHGIKYAKSNPLGTGRVALWLADRECKVTMGTKLASPQGFKSKKMKMEVK